MPIAGQLIFEIGANVASLQRDMELAKRQIGGFVRDTQRLFATLGGAVGIGSITAAFHSMINAAAEAEKQEQKLAAALRSRGIVQKEVTQALLEHSRQLQENTIFSDDQINAAKRFAISLGTLPSQLNQVVEMGMQVAVLYDKDLTEATKIVTMAMAGLGKGFREIDPDIARLIPTIKTAEERFKILNERFSADVLRDMDTYAGRVQKFKNQWDEFSEATGNIFLPALKAILWHLTEILKAPYKFAPGEFQIYGDEPFQKDKANIDKILKDADKRFKKSPKAETHAKEIQKIAEHAYMREMELLEARDKEETKYFEDLRKVTVDYYKIVMDQEAWILETKRKSAESYLIFRADFFKREEELYNQSLQNQISALQGAWGIMGTMPQAEGMAAVFNVSQAEQQYEARQSNFDKMFEQAYNHYQDMQMLYLGHKDWELKTQQAYDDMMLAYDRVTNAQRLQSTLTYLSVAQSAIAAYNAFSKKESVALFAVSKAVAIAQAIIAGHLAAMQAAAAMAMFGPHAAAAAYAQMMTLTYINAALMAATAIGQVVAGKVGGGAPSVGGGVVQTMPATQLQGTVAEPEKVRPTHVTQIYFYGNVFEADKLARELVPALEKAWSDNAR